MGKDRIEAFVNVGYYMGGMTADGYVNTGNSFIANDIKISVSADTLKLLSGTNALGIGNINTPTFNSENSPDQKSTSSVTPLASNSATIADGENSTSSATISLSDAVSKIMERIEKLEADDIILKSQQVLGAQTPSASSSGTFTNISVFGSATLSDTVVNGRLNIGTLTFDNINNSVDAVGILKLQALALDSIQFESGSIEMDKDGNLKINKGVVVGNDQMRGSVILTANHNTVDIIPTTPWSSPPKSIIITPSFITSSAVVRLETTGAKVEVGQTSPQDQKIYWVAIW